MDKRNVYNIHNEFSVLLGVADMGFKLYYLTTFQSLSLNDFMFKSPAGDEYFYKSFREEFGHVNPGFAWGMAKDLVPERGLRPVVNVDLNFGRWDERWEDYDDAGTPLGQRVRYGQNRLVLGTSLGLGGFTVYNRKIMENPAEYRNEQNEQKEKVKSDFKLNVDLEYGIKVHFYDNDYSYFHAGDELNRIKRAKGSRVVNTSELIVYDINQLEHKLFPSLTAIWTGHRLGLASRLGVEFGAAKVTETRKELHPELGNLDGSLVKSGVDRTKTDYAINPKLDLAMKWEMVPEKLFLNAGGAIRFFRVDFMSEERTTYSYTVLEGEVADRKETEVRNTFEPAQTILSLGVTFNPTKNIGLQATLGIASNTVNVFHINPNDGFFNFSNILLTVKF